MILNQYLSIFLYVQYLMVSFQALRIQQHLLFAVLLEEFFS